MTDSRDDAVLDDDGAVDGADRGGVARAVSGFAAQPFMSELGARVVAAGVGTMTVELLVRDGLTQQHGFVHAGAVTSVLDTACGFAALSVMEPGTGVLTVEFKVNLLRSATGPVVTAVATVVRTGRSLVVCQAHAVNGTDADTPACALMTATMMCVRDRPDVRD